MLENQKNILIELSKLTKTWAVKNQSYECAAQSRDIEKCLERSDCYIDGSQTITTPEEFYTKIKLIFDTLGQINQVNQEYSDIQAKFENYKNIIFKQLRRQELLNKLFGDID